MSFPPPNTPQAGPPAFQRRLLSLSTLASFLVAGLFLYFLLARFDIDLKDTWSQVRGSNPWYYLLALLVYYASFPVRGWRWRIIAANARLVNTGGSLPSAMHCARFILLGWFVNTISPLRLGEAYRVYAFAQEAKASFPRVLGTVVAERLVDLVVVTVLLLLAAGVVGATQGLVPSPLLLAVAFAAVGGSVALLLAMRLLGLPLARFLPRRLREAYQRLYEGTMSSFRRLPLVVVLSVVAWLLEAGRLFFVLLALGQSLHPSLVLFVALASALLTAVPLTPGGLGIVELGATGLLMLELPRSVAVAVTLVDRSISYLSVVAIGGLLFLWQQLRGARGRRDPMER